MDPQKSSMWNSLGIYYAIGGIGIGLGFLATSQFLKVYTYIKKPVWLTPQYAEWVGAWWLVYALGTCLSFILCLLLFFCDTRLRSSAQPSRRSIDEPSPSIPSKNVCWEILTWIKSLLFNLRYMGVICSAVIEALLIKGYLAFLSKHIEYQFRTTSSHSSIYMGVISLFSVILGAPLGAFCVKRYDMNGRQCAKFCSIVLGLSSFFFLGLMLHCREPTIGTTPSAPVLFTAFDQGFFEEQPLIESDRIESPCKKKCSKQSIEPLSNNL